MNDSPETPPKETVTKTDIFRANEALNVQKLMPAAGWPTVDSYKPSGKMGALGFPLLLASLIVFPPLAALLYEKLWHFGGLLAFSAIALGVFVGALMLVSVRLGKVRKPILAGVLGAIIGLATFSGTMVLEAQKYRTAYIAADAAYLMKAKKIKEQQALDLTTQFYTPANMTRVYWQDRATQGVTLTSSRRQTQSQISGSTFWALKALELALVTACAGGIAANAASRRFSEEYDMWYSSKLIYEVHPLHVGQFLDELHAGNFEAAARIGALPSAEKLHGALATVSYLKEKPGAVLTVKATTNKNKPLQPIYEQALSSEEAHAFWPQFPVAA
ncbi:MAG TPA: hypothetical protein VF681_00350 [Abditibacteriaceae bacterium]|jgi:hypothetical protein